MTTFARSILARVAAAPVLYTVFTDAEWDAVQQFGRHGWVSWSKESGGLVSATAVGREELRIENEKRAAQQRPQVTEIVW